MSKRNKDDKSIYQFASLGVGKFSHGEVTFDADKETTCPNCKEHYNFGRTKVIKIYPKFPNKYGQDCFYTELDLNYPSADACGNGDQYPRLSFIVKGCRLVLEDKIHDSTPEESINMRGSELNIKINKMLTTEEIKFNENNR